MAKMNDAYMQVLINVIGAVESGGQTYGNRRYEAYAGAYKNSNAEHTCTLGWAQNYGYEAMELCKKIFAENPEEFRKADTANIESKLTADWVAMRWNPNEAEKNALIAIITTETGKRCQDELFAGLMEKYLDKALDFDSTMSIQAQMMWCEIQHLGGLTPTKRIFSRAAKPYSPDTIFNSLLLDQKDTSNDNQVGDKKFQSRHECCVKWIKQYVSAVITTTTTTTTNENGGNSMAKIKGIDVSYHNGTIQWDKVANDGVKFAVIREGYRKVIDSKFLDNVSGALSNGISVMVYHFIYTDGATIKENAESTVNNVKKSGLDPATTWIWADLEYDTWTKNGEACTKDKCSKYTKEYIDALKSLGCKKVGVYMNNDYYKNCYTTEIINGFPVWLADYSGDADHPCVIQQYSSSGSVNGMNGNVDMNYLFDSSYLGNTTTEKKEENTTGGTKMTEAQLRQSVVDYLNQYIGISEGSTQHKAILSMFNNSGLCSRYKMTVNDAWCATAVSAAFIANGLAGKQGSGKLFECVECSCYYMVEYAKTQGIWVENDAHVPSIGDVILYDWDDSGSGDNTGCPDHVGIICGVSGSTMTIIEGNYNNSVKKRTLSVNARYIRGFITPNYAKYADGTSNAVTQTGTTTTISTTNNGELKLGSTGDAVKTMQTMLIACGYSCGSAGVDGSFGNATLSALKKFQQENGLTVDGVYGSKSKSVLEVLYKQKTTTTSSSKTLNKEIKWNGKVTADSLNVRKLPGVENGTCTFSPLKQGTKVGVCDSMKASDGDKWYYIKYNGKYGFVHSAWIKKI